MKSQISISARKRCLMEKNRLESALSTCDYCSESFKEHRKCYHRIEKDINRNMRNCLIV